MSDRSRALGRWTLSSSESTSEGRPEVLRPRLAFMEECGTAGSELGTDTRKISQKVSTAESKILLSFVSLLNR